MILNSPQLYANITPTLVYENISRIVRHKVKHLFEDGFFNCICRCAELINTSSLLMQPAE